MAFRKIFFAACLVLSVLCLAAGYGVAGQWPGVVMAIITGLAWLLARKYSDSGLPLLCLLASVGMAVVGRLTGVTPLLMICGSGMALAVWDLLLLDVALESHSSGEQTRQYENKHLQSLVLALGSGLCVAFLGRFLTLQIPFALLILFIVLTVFGLDRVWSHIEKMVYR
jgi:hypothetical protein